MMNTQTMTLEQIRSAGLELLCQHLGAIGMVRFLQQSETGWGDYTADRHQWLGDPPLEDVVAEIQADYPGLSTNQEVH